MSNLELSQQQQTQLAKLEQEAEKSLLGSSALPLVMGGVAFVLFNPIGLPVAVLAASPFLWNAVKNAHRNGLNAEYMAKTGLFAHSLNGNQLIRLTRIVGKDAVVNQLLAAHEDGQPFSGDALDYLEALGYDLEPEQDLKTFLANPDDRPRLPSADTITLDAQVVETAPTPEPIPSTIEPGEKWIKDLLFDNEGKLRRQHLGLNGKSQSGKSTVGTHLMACIAGNQHPKIWLVNPKHIASNPDWKGITPYCKSIDGYLDALAFFNQLLQQRCEDPRFDYATAEPWFLILEELDWAVSHHGKKDVLALIRPLVKVGAALKIVVIMVGQSAQAEYFSSSDWRQFSRIILGVEALAFIQNPQFTYSNQVKQPLKEMAEYLLQEKERFALVIPFEGLPTIEPIPDLSKVPVPQVTGNEVAIEDSPATGIQQNFMDGIRHKLEWLIHQDDSTEPAKQVPTEITYPMIAIVEYCKKKGKPLSIRDIQSGRLPELKGMNSDEIRQLCFSLQDLGKGRFEGNIFYPC